MNFQGKILLADDEAHIRKFVGVLLGRLGTPTLVEARNGEEAIALFEREAPDLVLLDVNMPVIDGLGALARIRELDPGAVVVMLTSLVNRQTIDECLRLGAADYIRKDNPPAEILAQLQRIVAAAFDEPPPATPAQP